MGGLYNVNIWKLEVCLFCGYLFNFQSYDGMVVSRADLQSSCGTSPDTPEAYFAILVESSRYLTLDSFLNVTLFGRLVITYWEFLTNATMLSNCYCYGSDALPVFSTLVSTAQVAGSWIAYETMTARTSWVWRQHIFPLNHGDTQFKMRWTQTDSIIIPTWKGAWGLDSISVTGQRCTLKFFNLLFTKLNSSRPCFESSFSPFYTRWNC